MTAQEVVRMRIARSPSVQLPGLATSQEVRERMVSAAAIAAGRCYPFPSTGDCHPTYDDMRGADGSVVCCPRSVGSSSSAMTAVKPGVPAWAWVAGGLALGGVALLVLRKR